MRNFGSLRHPAVRLGLCFAGMAVAILLSGSRRATGQSESARLGLPQDWSHHHVVFSSTQDIPTLLKIRQDPRVLHQWLRHNAPRFALSQADFAANEEITRELQEGVDDEDGQEKRDAREKRVDWSVHLGAAGTFLPHFQYPAKYNFDVNAPPDCVNDYAVFPTNRAGAANQATIVGYNQLYSTQGAAGGFCNHNGPAVKWAYRTAGGAIRSSPMLSLDGKKVSFVSRIPGIVHVLTIGTTGSNGTSVTLPAIPGAGNNAVEVRITLNGANNVSFSSLFVDYVHDAGYVGDDAGLLHKITGVFNGTPAEVTTGGWPISVSAGGVGLNDPVFDSVSENVFVTDQTGHLSYVRETGSTIGTCAAGPLPCLGFPSVAVSGGGAIVDSPVVDFVTGRVFTETRSSGGHAQIVQTDTALGNVVRANVGNADGNAGRPLHNGAFDNNYLNNVSTGFYYVCGKASNATLDPTLHRIGFNSAGVMNSTADAAALRLGRAAGQCSPITEFFNTGSTPNKDWLFVSVNTACGNTPVLPGGCVMSYDITSGMPAALTHFAAELNGTSGIIVDNVSQAAQASSIYFTNQGNGACGDGIATGGCAVKLTQSGLQ